jgi:A/G-specific adenine glycosylase
VKSAVADERAIQRALRAWYRREKRALPWRATRDPYAIWISEVMLQQTTVAVAEKRWRRFLDRFPDAASLAAAPERAVLAEWSGLGYYARARNLRRTAVRIATDGGALPRSVAELRALPGIGAYTAAAIASIAFDVPAAAVDGNVVRVLARLFAVRVDAKAADGRIREIAERLLPARGAGEHNQALMELGATLCTPLRPRCDVCPVGRFCRAAREGRPERYPRPSARKPLRHVRLAAGFARRGARIVVHEDLEMVKGHVSVPAVRLGADEEPASALAASWPSVAGRAVTALEPLGTLRHSVLERRYTVEVFRVHEGARERRGTARVMSLNELRELPRGGLLSKVLALVNLSFAP